VDFSSWQMKKVKWTDIRDFQITGANNYGMIIYLIDSLDCCVLFNELDVPLYSGS
jgi:hypothetical protein